MQVQADPPRPDGRYTAPLGLGLEVKTVFLTAGDLAGVATNAVIEVYEQDF